MDADFVSHVGRVSDPYSFLLIRIQIQRIRMEANTDPDPDPIRIQSGSRALMIKNWKKITTEKKIKFFWSKTAIYLSLSLHKVCPSYRRSLQLTKEAIQHFKTWFFSTFVGHFCPPGSGSAFKLRIRIRIYNTEFFITQKRTFNTSKLKFPLLLWVL